MNSIRVLKGIVWFKPLFSEIFVENIDMDFLADLAFLMPKLMIKKNGQVLM